MGMDTENNSTYNSSIGAGLGYMTSQNGGQDGRHGSKMADSNPGWRSSPDKGHDL